MAQPPRGSWAYPSAFGARDRFMVDQFNQTRSFVLELAIVVILIIEFFFLFRGK